MTHPAHEIGIGQLHITSEDSNLVASGVGSCLVVSLFDKKKHIGGLLHAALPRKIISKYTEGFYVDSGISKMLTLLKVKGSLVEDLEAKMAGGAQMFSKIEPQFINVGQDNADMAKHQLKLLGIPLNGSSVGGHLGRTVKLSTQTGIMTVKIMF